MAQTGPRNPERRRSRRRPGLRTAPGNPAAAAPRASRRRSRPPAPLQPGQRLPHTALAATLPTAPALTAQHSQARSPRPRAPFARLTSPLWQLELAALPPAAGATGRAPGPPQCSMGQGVQKPRVRRRKCSVRDFNSREALRRQYGEGRAGPALLGGRWACGERWWQRWEVPQVTWCL